MIQAVRFNQNISFKGSEVQKPQAQEENQEVQSADDKAFAAKAKETFGSLRDSAVDTIKDINEVTCTSAGLAKGIVGGSIGAVGVGVLGKNIKLSKGDIAGTVQGSIKDLTVGAAKALKFIPQILTKSPVKNIQSVAGMPKKFFGTYLKGHKVTASLALAAGLSIAAFKTIQGKLNGNLKNANVDHRLNRGHIDA